MSLAVGVAWESGGAHRDASTSSAFPDGNPLAGGADSAREREVEGESGRLLDAFVAEL